MTRRCSIGTAIVCALASLALSAGIRAAQAPAATAPARTLTITGAVGTSMSLTLDELKALPRKRVEFKESGKSTSYEGVLVDELLKRAGAPVGSDLRGNAMASYVIASAPDGYQVVFSLAELDSALTANDIIVADTMDGKPLPDTLGPFRIIAPRDTHGSRFVRNLTRLELVRLRK